MTNTGGVDAREINSVITWLADLTTAEHLPQKLLVLHQFKLSMIRSEQTLNRSRQQVSLLIQMDGQGPPELKDQTWAAVTAAAPPGILFGWKNFYRKRHTHRHPRADHEQKAHAAVDFLRMNAPHTH